MVNLSSSAILCFISLLGLSLANIHFTWIEPSCDPLLTDWNGCLKGRNCEVDGRSAKSAIWSQDVNSPVAAATLQIDRLTSANEHSQQMDDVAR